MSIEAFDGAAGCGKTYSVFATLRAQLDAVALRDGQRVLAVTFMHGARSRLNTELGGLKELRNRYDAMTIDSLAGTICRRWKSRVAELGMTVPAHTAFDDVVDVAGALLSFADVRGWVAATYPVILVDEAQDLQDSRLVIIEELTKRSRIILAFDEFQCLNSKNRPVAITDWISAKCEPTVLLENKRTNNQQLLTAALEVRRGIPISVTRNLTFNIVVATHPKGALPVYAATVIACQLLKEAGPFAILTPAKGSPYVLKIVEMLQNGFSTKKRAYPAFKLDWEDATERIDSAARDKISEKTTYTISSIEALFAPYQDSTAVEATIRSLKKAKSVKGIVSFSGSDVLGIFDRNKTLQRQFSRPKQQLRTAMTIHQAKNREFDNVVVIWPFGIPPTAEDRRRLLYNAITRAKKTCLIVVQNDDLFAQSPFV